MENIRKINEDIIDSVSGNTEPERSSSAVVSDDSNVKEWNEDDYDFKCTFIIYNERESSLKPFAEKIENVLDSLHFIDEHSYVRTYSVDNEFTKSAHQMDFMFNFPKDMEEENIYVMHKYVCLVFGEKENVFVEYAGKNIDTLEWDEFTTRIGVKECVRMFTFNHYAFTRRDHEEISDIANCLNALVWPEFIDSDNLGHWIFENAKKRIKHQESKKKVNEDIVDIANIQNDDEISSSQQVQERIPEEREPLSPEKFQFLIILDYEVMRTDNEQTTASRIPGVANRIADFLENFPFVDDVSEPYFTSKDGMLTDGNKTLINFSTFTTNVQANIGFNLSYGWLSIFQATGFLTKIMLFAQNKYNNYGEYWSLCESTGTGWQKPSELIYRKSLFDFKGEFNTICDKTYMEISVKAAIKGMREKLQPSVLKLTGFKDFKSVNDGITHYLENFRNHEILGKR